MSDNSQLFQYKSLLNESVLDTIDIINVNEMTVNDNLYISTAQVDSLPTDNSTIQYTNYQLSVKNSGIVSSKLAPSLSIGTLSVGTIGSSLIPTANNTYDLGSQNNQWRLLYINNLNVSTATFTTIFTTHLLGTNATFTNLNATNATFSAVRATNLTADTLFINNTLGFSNLTRGDILISSGSSNITKLSVGSANQVLTITSSYPTWQTPTSYASPLTTKGDLFAYSFADTRLPVGTNGYLLTADSTSSIGLSYKTDITLNTLLLQSNSTFSGKVRIANDAILNDTYQSGYSRDGNGRVCCKLESQSSASADTPYFLLKGATNNTTPNGPLLGVDSAYGGTDIDMSLQAKNNGTIRLLSSVAFSGIAQTSATFSTVVYGATTGEGTPFTLTTNKCWWTRVGTDFMKVFIYVAWSSKSTASGGLRMKLPYDIRTAGLSERVCGSIGYVSGMPINDQLVVLGENTTSYNTFCYFYRLQNTAAAVEVLVADVNATGLIFFELEYFCGSPT